MIFQEGLYNLKNGFKILKNYDRPFIDNFASFQMNQKLYISGGGKYVEGGLKCSQELYSLDYSAITENHPPMPTARCSHSLTGRNFKLLAIGGYGGTTLSVVE